MGAGMVRRVRRAIVLAPAILLLAGASAHGQSGDGRNTGYGHSADYGRNGVYLGLAGTYAIENFQNTGPLSIDDGLGINGRLGYRFHPHFSVELAFEWIDEFEIEGTAFRVETWTLTGNAKLHFLTGQIQPFVLAGLGVMRADLRGGGVGSITDDEDFVARFGGGVDLYASEHIVIAVEASYVRPTDGVDDLDYVSLGWGLQYRF
jgi:opacity protein-like surface antigen